MKFLQVDLLDEATLVSVRETLTNTHGGLDVLVCNAAIVSTSKHDIIITVL